MVAGLLGVAAMAVQNAGSRLILANHGPTTMMTGNTTQAVIDLVDMLRGLPEEIPASQEAIEAAGSGHSRLYRGRVARRLRLCHLLILVFDHSDRGAARGGVDGGGEARGERLNGA